MRIHSTTVGPAVEQQTTMAGRNLLLPEDHVVFQQIRCGGCKKLLGEISGARVNTMTIRIKCPRCGLVYT